MMLPQSRPICVGITSVKDGQTIPKYTERNVQLRRSQPSETRREMFVAQLRIRSCVLLVLINLGTRYAFWKQNVIKFLLLHF